VLIKSETVMRISAGEAPFLAGLNGAAEAAVDFIGLLRRD
jgi:hypothetical protein